MTITEAISRIKRAGHDISGEYSDAECLAFLNDAVEETAVLLASLRYAPLIRETILTDGDALPTDYISSVGVHPYRLSENTIRLTGGHTQMTLRYYAAPPALAEGGTLPFDNPTVIESVICAAIIRALRQNEYDTSAEEAHLANLRNALAAAFGAKGGRS